MEKIVSPQIVERIVKSVDPNLEVLGFTCELGSSVGDNYMSIMYAVKIQVNNFNTTGDKSNLSIMLKTMPKNDIRIQMINDMGAFEKEMDVFQKVFPQMLDFQRSCGLEESEIFTAYPHCYCTFHDGKNDYIAMEDLRDKK